MITALEILDSAVKIGLGALISGVTAYWVGRDKARLETKKTFQEERRSLIKQVSLDVAKSADAIDDYFHVTHVTPTESLSQKLSESSALLLTAHKVSGQALALASLLGSPTLSAALQAYAASVEELHRHFAPIDPDASFDVALAHELAARLDAQLQSVRDALATSYSKTDATLRSRPCSSGGDPGSFLELIGLSVPRRVRRALPFRPCDRVSPPKGALGKGLRRPPRVPKRHRKQRSRDANESRRFSSGFDHLARRGKTERVMRSALREWAAPGCPGTLPVERVRQWR